MNGSEQFSCREADTSRNSKFRYIQEWFRFSAVAKSSVGETERADPDDPSHHVSAVCSVATKLVHLASRMKVWKSTELDSMKIAEHETYLKLTLINYYEGTQYTTCILLDYWYVASR